MMEYLQNPHLGTINTTYRGNAWKSGKFIEGASFQTYPYKKSVKHLIAQNPQKKEQKLDTYKLPMMKLQKKYREQITRLGHATFLFQLGTKTLLTDPCLYDLPLIKRKAPIHDRTDAIDTIDYVLISHGHRDHLDKNQ